MLKEKYDQMSGDREGFLEQARMQSLLSIPSLIPPDGTGTSFQKLHKPFQSIGARGVNAMANKLAVALVPPTEPFFRLTVDTTEDELKEADAQTLAQVDSQLSMFEQKILGKITGRGDRAAIQEGLKHLLVGGNVCLRVGDEHTRFYSLDEFVVSRDGEGGLLSVITRECLDYETYANSQYVEKPSGSDTYKEKVVDVYTICCLKDGKWYVYEEVDGNKITKSEAYYPKDACPYLVLRFNRIDGQSYGRGYLENLYGDLRSLEALSQAMVEGAAISALCKTLVNPNGITNMREWERLPNGGVMPGNPSDVAMVRSDKGGDLAVTASQVDRLKADLSQSFLLTQSVQRNAERVTATEIQAVTQELEQVLGGVYTVLAEEFQRAYAKRMINVLQKSGDIPRFPEGVVDVSITTGVSAIGRGIDRQRMTEFLGGLQQALGPETMRYINVPVAISKLAASYGIPTDGLIKSEEQLASEAQQEQQSQMMSQLGPQAIQVAGQVTSEQIKQGAPEDGNQEIPAEPQA